MRPRLLLVALTLALALGPASACARRGIAIVQRAHARELVCDARYVRVEHREGERYVSRGCSFEADWDCASGECVLRDTRAYGMGAP